MQNNVLVPKATNRLVLFIRLNLIYREGWRKAPSSRYLDLWTLAHAGTWYLGCCLRENYLGYNGSQLSRGQVGGIWEAEMPLDSLDLSMDAFGSSLWLFEKCSYRSRGSTRVQIARSPDTTHSVIYLSRDYNNIRDRYPYLSTTTYLRVSSA